MDSSYFKIYENCIPVKGAARSVISDLQRNTLSFIPNDLYEILTVHSQKSIGEIKELYGVENTETINEYFDFLLADEFIFLCQKEELALFPPIDLTWDSPSIITNAIIDIGKESCHDFKLIFNQLEDLGCKDIQLRFFVFRPLEEIAAILNLLRNSRIKSVQIFVRFDKDLDFEKLKVFTEKHLRIDSFVVHAAPEETQINSNIPVASAVTFTKQEIKDETHCGFISSKYFSINIEMFTESQKHNSCLNRKIAIDKSGAIKNCPALKMQYGNINTIPLIDAINLNPEIKNLWKINKDQILVCKDCEFRYSCSDCRAFIQSPGDILSKPIKCSYDPYTMEWAD